MRFKNRKKTMELKKIHFTGEDWNRNVLAITFWKRLQLIRYLWVEERHNPDQRKNDVFVPSLKSKTIKNSQKRFHGNLIISFTKRHSSSLGLLYVHNRRKIKHPFLNVSFLFYSNRLTEFSIENFKKIRDEIKNYWRFHLLRRCGELKLRVGRLREMLCQSI